MQNVDTASYIWSSVSQLLCLLSAISSSSFFIIAPDDGIVAEKLDLSFQKDLVLAWGFFHKLYV